MQNKHFTIYSAQKNVNLRGYDDESLTNLLEIFEKIKLAKGKFTLAKFEYQKNIFER